MKNTSSYDGTYVIHLRKNDLCKVPGSAAHICYGAYRDGMTVAEFYRAFKRVKARNAKFPGMRNKCAGAILTYDLSHGIVSLSPGA